MMKPETPAWDVLDDLLVDPQEVHDDDLRYVSQSPRRQKACDDSVDPPVERLPPPMELREVDLVGLVRGRTRPVPQWS